MCTRTSSALSAFTSNAYLPHHKKKKKKKDEKAIRDQQKFHEPEA